MVSKVIYLRVSKKELNENSQLPPILKKFDLKKKDCLILQEKLSGYDEEVQVKRHSLNKLLGMIENKEVSDIYIYSLERVYRNFNWLMEFYFKCQKNGIEIHSYLQPEISIVQGNNPTEKLMKLFPIIISGYVAEQESYLISERTKKAFSVDDKGDRISYKGNKAGRKTDITNEDKKLIIDLSKDMSYREIRDIFYNDNKKIGLGTISNIINENGNK